MRGQTLCPTVVGRRPPREAALGKPLVAEPKSLAVVHEQLQRCRLAIAEDEDGAGERIVLEGLLAESGEAIDPTSKVDRLDDDKDLHLWCDLEHPWAFQKLRDSASISAAS